MARYLVLLVFLSIKNYQLLRRYISGGFDGN